MATVFEGRFFLMCEQGCGAYWAFQEEKFIKPPTENWPHEQWGYEGLHSIEDEDYLIALNPDGTIFWEGTARINLLGQPIFRNRWWNYLLGDVITKEIWGEIFMKELRGTIVRD